jgi:hypothetical protein
LGHGVPEEKILPTPLWCKENFMRWENLKSQKKSKRIFIIGNGPSLSTRDLDILHEANELTFAFNKIYLAFKKSNFRPTYYMVEDLLVAQNNTQKINSLIEFPKFMPEFLTRHLEFSNNDFIYGLNRPQKSYLKAIQPSTDFKNFGWGGAVTCTAIQASLFLGYRRIYLLGVDNSFHNFEQDPLRKHLIGAGEINHFLPEYRPIGEKWNPPYTKITNDHFAMTKQLAKEQGSEIINCTRGGAVEIFPKISLEDIMQSG